MSPYHLKLIEKLYMKYTGNMTTGKETNEKVGKMTIHCEPTHNSKRKQEFLALVANRMFEKTVHYPDYRACTIVKD